MTKKIHHQKANHQTAQTIPIPIPEHDALRSLGHVCGVGEAEEVAQVLVASLPLDGLRLERWQIRFAVSRQNKGQTLVFKHKRSSEGYAIRLHLSGKWAPLLGFSGTVQGSAMPIFSRNSFDRGGVKAVSFCQAILSLMLKLKPVWPD